MTIFGIKKIEKANNLVTYIKGILKKYRQIASELIIKGETQKANDVIEKIKIYEKQLIVAEKNLETEKEKYEKYEKTNNIVTYIKNKLKNDRQIASKLIIEGETEKTIKLLEKIKIYEEQLIVEKSNLKMNEKENETAPKHYVMSDIHGMYCSYKEAMDRVDKYDHVYILGNVIDRGREGIKILQDIIKRQSDIQNNPQITFLLGDHEILFLETISSMIKYKLKSTDIQIILNRQIKQKLLSRAKLDYSDKHEDSDKLKVQEYQQEIDIYDKLLEEKGMNKSVIENIGMWLWDNKGATTLYSYLNLGGSELDLKSKAQEQIYNFLCNSYSAMPPKDKKILEIMKQTEKGYIREDTGNEHNNKDKIVLYCIEDEKEQSKMER